MLHKKFIAGLCFVVLFIAVREVELTPIVTLPPENVAIWTSTTESKDILMTSSEAPSVISGFGVGTTTKKIGRDDGPRKLGESETNLTDVSIKLNDSSSTINDTTVVILPVTRSSDIDNQTRVTEATVPELLTKTGSSTSSTNPTEVAQLSVTSQSLTLKDAEEDVKKITVTSTEPPLTDLQTSTVINTPIKIDVINSTVSSNVTEGDYRDTAPPEYHPYIEEILRNDETDDNNTSTQAPPIRIKSEGYHSPQNDLTTNHPYGPLPKFGEKEMNKLRLNHWRVNQILKGSESHYEDPKPGRLGTGKGSVQLQARKYNPSSAFLGQKRASSVAIAASPVVKSSIDQDEFHKSILASDTDAAMENDTTSPSKLRTFFNWISNPLKKKTRVENERIKQAKAQQPILPFALGYRGDFLFW